MIDSRGVAKRHSAPFWAAVEYSFFPFLLLIATPTLLRHFDALYGLWIFVLSSAGLGALFTLGAGPSTTRFVAYWSATNDTLHVIQTVQSALCFSLVCVLPPMIALLFFREYIAEEWLANLGSTFQVGAALLVVAVLIPLNEVDAILAGALRGLDEWRANAVAEILGRGFLIAGATQIAFHNLDVTALLLWTIAAYVGKVAIRALLLLKNLPDLITPAPVNTSVLHNVLQFGRWQWLQSLGAFLFSTLDRIIVGASLGASALAQYSVCLQLSQQVHAIPAAIGATLYPKATRIAAVNKTISRNQLWGFVMLPTTLGILIGTCLLVYGGEILSLWIDPTFGEENQLLLTYLTIAFLVLVLNVAPHYLLLGLGEPRFLAVTNLVAGLVCLVVIWILLDFQGLYALAVGRTIYGIVALITCIRIWKYVA